MEGPSRNLVASPIYRITRISPVLGLASLFWAACALSYWISKELSQSLCFDIAFGLLAISLIACCQAKSKSKHLFYIVIAVAVAFSGLSAGFVKGEHLHECKAAILEAQGAHDLVLIATADSSSGFYGASTPCIAWSDEFGLLSLCLQSGQADDFFFGQACKASVAFAAEKESQSDQLWKRGYAANARLKTKEEFQWITPFAKIRASFVESVQQADIDDDGINMLLALSCGFREGLRGSQTYSQYQTAGLAHIVAVSGAHLNIIIMLAGVALSRIKLHKRKRLTMSLGLIFIFLILCAVPISAVRAGIMASLGCASYFAKRRTATQNALAVCVATCLVIDPSLSLSVSFCLSALSTLGIILLSPYLDALLGKTFLRKCNTLRQTLALTAAANIATMPLCSALFAQISLISPLSNVLVGIVFAPLCALCVGCQLLYALLGVLPQGLLLMALGLCRFTNFVVAHLSMIPFAAIPSYGSVITGLLTSFVMGVVLLFAQRKLDSTLHSACLWGVLLAIVLALFACFHTLLNSGNANDVSLSALDVGQGDALLLQDGSSSILIDTGNQDNLLKRQLALKGVSTLDALLISHPDDDHCGSLESLLAVMQIGTIVVAQPLLECPCMKCRDLRKTLERYQCHVEGAKVGDSYLTNRCKINVLWPEKFQEEGGNQDSLCVQIIVDAEEDGIWDYSALLVGDAESQTLEQMAAEKLLPKADVFKVGHHGSKNSCSVVALKAISPRVALVSVGEANRYGHPTPTALNLLSSYGAKSYRTDQQGTITCLFQTDALRVVAER